MAEIFTNPFPGMNPYMEEPAAWAGVHLHLLANCGQQLAPQIRPRYRVHTERYLRIGKDVPRYRPDLRLHKTRLSGTVQPAARPVTEATLILENIPYEDTDTPPHLEILTEEGEIITVIEVLSPVNKTSEYDDYLNKRHRLLQAGVNLVEVDLLRGGQRIPSSLPIDLPYMAIVSRAAEYPRARAWAISWAQPCPILPVPLRHDEPEVSLDLSEAIQQAYNVEFAGFVDYTAAPPGNLKPEWQQEIEDLLRKTGLRE